MNSNKKEPHEEALKLMIGKATVKPLVIHDTKRFRLLRLAFYVTLQKNVEENLQLYPHWNVGLMKEIYKLANKGIDRELEKLYK